jgi:hypothetical protein
MTPSRKHPSAAFWATVVVVVLLVAYPLSFGPACWLTAQPLEYGGRNDGWDMPPRWMLIYRPFGVVLNKGDSAIKTAVNWWATIGIKRTSCAVVPVGSGRYESAVGFRRPN